MSDNSVKNLFPEPTDPNGDSPSEIFEFLGKYGLRNLAYDGDVGCNPGYLFRGEAAFRYPLQSSLERELRGALNDGDSLTDDQIKQREREIIQEFLEGEGSRLADIIDRRSRGTSIRSWDNIWWWLSFMQHYERRTRLIDFARDIRIALYFAIEQHDNHLKNHKEDLDLIIYCFPCKDLKHPHDRESNKCPFWPKPGVVGVDMNLVIGCQIDFPWMKLHKDSWYETNEPKHWEKSNQTWGWDRPDYRNPRLEFQKGMFVYPYAYPTCLTKNGDSWLVQNLRTSGLNVRALPATQIRIGKKHVDALKTYLKDHYQLTAATVYLDYKKLDC